MRALEQAWYSGRFWPRLLLPLTWLYCWIVRRRRAAYLADRKPRYRAPVPVIVVGNITVGGTGKTPLVAYLVEELRKLGYRPGVVSRGYGATAPSYPWFVDAETPPEYGGDEPVLLVRRTACPLVVDPVRSRAVTHLLEKSDCDVVISDDGLQHLALDRDVEIVVIDGARGLGNGLCLPAGPLREPAGRLREVDLVVTNGMSAAALPRATHTMQLVPGVLMPVGKNQSEGATAPALGAVHAVAGIGNPGRFFSTLRSMGYAVIEHPFVDHHQYTETDVVFGDGLAVVMTEKDAVKCREFAGGQHWYLPVTADLETGFLQAVANLLSTAQLKLQ